MHFLNTTRTAALTAVCVAALLVGANFAASAQDAAEGAQPAAPTGAAATAPATQRDPAEVLAKVGSQTITEQELVIAEQEFGSELAQVPPEQKRGVLIDALVNMELLAQAARDAGLDKGPVFENRLQFVTLQALRNAFVEQSIVGSVSPEDVQKTYQDVVVAQHKPEEQVRARHILVESKEAAEKVIADLKGGADFAELAKQSKDPSGQNGGDLGYFGRGQMVPPFEQAAFALEPGATTEQPVESQFGWHVIRVDEKRMSQPPALADVEAQLRQYVLRGKFESVMADLRSKYPVEIVGGPGAPAEPVPAGEAGGGTPAESAAPAAAEPPAAGTAVQPQN